MLFLLYQKKGELETMNTIVKKGTWIIVAAALLVSTVVGAFIFSAAGNNSSNSVLTRTVTLEASDVSNYNNLTVADIEYIGVLYDAYIEENPTAEEDVINEYLRGELRRLSVEKPIDNVCLNLPLSLAEVLNAFNHPIAAPQAYTASKLATSKSEAFYVLSARWKGNGDAFRHAYWNALMVKTIGAELAEKFATAHEASSPAGTEKTMDLQNNYYGRVYGNVYKTQSDDALAVTFRNLTTDGMLFRIAELNGTQYLLASNGEGLK